MDTITEKNVSPVCLELDDIVSTLKTSEVSYKELAHEQSTTYEEKMSTIAHEFTLVSERIASLKAQQKEKTNNINTFEKEISSIKEKELTTLLQDTQLRSRQTKSKVHDAETKRDQLLGLLEKKRRDKSVDKSEAEKHRILTELEKEACEKYTGLKIIPEKNDVIAFEFKYIDKSKPDKKYSFTLILHENNKYSLHHCQPSLPSISTLLDKLNSDRDIYAFIKQARKAFIESVHETI